MNSLQKVASAISGYSPEETSPRDDYFYAFKTIEEKLEQIELYAFNALDIVLNKKEIMDIYIYLTADPEFDGSHARYLAFTMLGYKEII